MKKSSLTTILTLMLVLGLYLIFQNMGRKQDSRPSPPTRVEVPDHNIKGSEIQGKVIKVQDGDTITLLIGKESHKIRLDGIDCPEKNQAYGQVARQYTADKSFGKYVRVIIRTKDRYGRYLGTVILPDGDNLNHELLKQGLAWHYKQYNDDRFLAALESDARERKEGLWSDKKPVPPWEFRQKRTKKT